MECGVVKERRKGHGKSQGMAERMNLQKFTVLLTMKSQLAVSLLFFIFKMSNYIKKISRKCKEAIITIHYQMKTVWKITNKSVKLAHGMKVNQPSL